MKKNYTARLLGFIFCFFIATTLNAQNIFAPDPFGYATKSASATVNLAQTDLIFMRENFQMRNGFKLVAFIDNNSNGEKDSDESNFPHSIFNYEINDDGTVHHVPSKSGVYILLENNENNSYNLGMTIDPVFASQYATSKNAFLHMNATEGMGLQTVYFPVTMIPFEDTAIYIFPQDEPKPGFTFSNKIMYVNNGTSTIASGTVNFVKDSALEINAISQSGTTTNSTGFSYDFTNLLPNEARFINVSMQVPVIPTIALGDFVTNSVSITNSGNDINLNNNRHTNTSIVVGSFDPNDKTESHGGKIVHSTFTANDYLTYIIRFENTGTAPALNVKVVDIIESKLDETSVRMLDASDNYVLDRIANTLTWRFDGINLPPSVAGTNVGHGYIIFQVKPKAGYAIGDIVANSADIFFDFNPAIVTNTVETEFVTTLGVAMFEKDQMAFYPNPVKDLLYLTFKDGSIDTVLVHDVLGKLVVSKPINDSSAQLDLSGLSNGMYFVKVMAGNQQQTIKIIKE